MQTQYVDQVDGRIPDMYINIGLIRCRLRIVYKSSGLFTFGLFTFVSYFLSFIQAMAKGSFLAKACYMESMSHKDKPVRPQSYFFLCCGLIEGHCDAFENYHVDGDGRVYVV